MNCVCGCAEDDHGHDQENPGSTACNACADCIAFEDSGENSDDGEDESDEDA